MTWAIVFAAMLLVLVLGLIGLLWLFVTYLPGLPWQ